MKITLVCHDIPYPSIHGGRVDMWRRIQAFANFGVELQLICWSNQTPTPEQLTEMHKYVVSVEAIAYQYNIWALFHRALDLFSYPLEVSSRIIRGQKLENLTQKVQEFNPDLIWLDGIYGGEIAKFLSQKFSVPLITRCHNIEHLYLQRLKSSATGLNKLKKILAVNHLESYEKNILKQSAIFYDISNEDLKFWQQLGFENGRYLPPLIDINCFQKSDNLANNDGDKYDIVFLGNLYSSNNVAGIYWLIDRVLPLVRTAQRDVRVLIAGANPTDAIKNLCRTTAGVSLHVNPDSTHAIYRSGRILVNPVLTGSGVCIKSLEMLGAEKPIVSTPQGIAGLPSSVQEYFHVAADPETFAQKIVNLLLNYYQPKIDINLLNLHFGSGKVEEILFDLRALT